MKFKDFITDGFILKAIIKFVEIIKRKSSEIKTIPTDNYNVLNYFILLYIPLILILDFMYRGIEYGAYQFLRWIVAGFALWTVYKFKDTENLKKFLLPFATIAIIFNPIIPLTFEKEFWQLLDIIVLLYFAVWVFVKKD